MPYNTDDVKSVVISKATQAIAAIIAAPDAGKRIAIDFLLLNASGGANTVTLTGTVAPVIDMADNETLVLQNSDHDPKGVFHCNDNQAFGLTLSAATAVTGYVRYRIIG
jgi:hypothetical protein